jgi:surface antigen
LAAQTQPGVDIGDVTVNNAAGAAAVNVQDGGNSLTIDATSLPLPTGAATSAIQTDKSQFTKITDGTDTALVTAAGEVNVIATAQPGVDIGDVTINNAAGASAVNVQDGGNSLTVDGTVAATQSGTWTIFANSTGYIVRLEEASATITYVGQAVPGSATSAASWSIKRLDSSSGLVVLWGGGTAAFTQIWDNRAALAYS